MQPITFRNTLIRQPPVLDILLDSFPDVNSILTLAQVSKEYPPLISESINRNPRLIHLFNTLVQEVEETNVDFLVPLFALESEFKMLRSPKRFTREILSLIPFVGDMTAEYFHYHIPTSEELWNACAEKYHFLEQHHDIDVPYLSGEKVDEIQWMCDPEGCYQFSTQQLEHSGLSFKQMRQFFSENWKGFGIAITKVALCKIAPAAGMIFTAKKVYDIGECYSRLRLFWKEGLTHHERKSALLHQRLLRLVLTNNTLAIRINHHENPEYSRIRMEYRKWLSEYSLTRFAKKQVQP